MDQKIFTMGSLFDGIGGFPLAAVRSGIVPLWASEIEAFPIDVTQKRFPNMVQLGDITQLNGALLTPVDIICGGSPCQDLSVAGKHIGLDGDRSSLFVHQVRIIREMREADKRRGRTGIDVRPRFAVWENVPGAFSCNDGKDFRQVVESFLHIEEPDLPPFENKAWQRAYSGAMIGDHSCTAWTIWDARYMGVPQRRRRVFMLTDFASHSPILILFSKVKRLPPPILFPCD